MNIKFSYNLISFKSNKLIYRILQNNKKSKEPKKLEENRKKEELESFINNSFCI